MTLYIQKGLPGKLLGKLQYKRKMQKNKQGKLLVWMRFKTYALNSQ